MRARTLIPVLLALVAIKLSLDHLADVDLFWHLRLGLDMLETYVLPKTIGYCWSLEGRPYLANDWLSEVLFALAFKAGGFGAVAVFKAIAAAGLVLLVYASAFIRSGGSERAAGLATAIAIVIAATNFIARPVLLGHACLAAEILLLELFVRGRRRAAAGIPVVFALWINLHGSWPVGLGPLAALGASAFVPIRMGRLGRRELPAGSPWILAVAGLAALAALLVNPVGPELLLRPFRLIGRRAELKVLDEWSPVPLTDPSAWFLLGAGVLLVVFCLRSRRPLPLFDLGLVALTLAMASGSALYHLAFAVTMAPVMAEPLASFLSPVGLTRTRVNGLVAGAAALALGPIAAVRLSQVEHDVRREAPVGAVAVLKESALAEERGFNYFDFGGYLVFEGVSTYVDGRLEPFLEAGIFREYLDFEASADLEGLEARGIRWILVPPTTRIAVGTEARAGWRVLYRARDAVLFARDPLPARP